MKGHFTGPEEHIHLPEMRPAAESHIESPEAEQKVLPRKRMDIFEAIYMRRSIRKFLDTPIEFDKLVEVTRAGSFAPCAGNLQNWKFIVETDRDVIKSMYSHTLEQEAFMTATAAVIVVADMDVAEKYYGMRGKRLYSVQNCAAAIENMLLAAHALGLGGIWIGAFDENRINDMFRVPSTSRTQAIVLFGYPDERPQARHMKHLWYVVNFHRYGLKYDRPHLITHDMAEEWERKRKEWRWAADRGTRKLGLESFRTEKSKEVMDAAVAKAKSRTRKLLAALKKDPKRRR
jgi:nitroreductase